MAAGTTRRPGRCRADREGAGDRSVAGVPGSADGTVCLVDRRLGVMTERFACGSGPDAPRVPFDQPRADLSLQSGDLPRHGGLRIAELDRGRRK